MKTIALNSIIITGTFDDYETGVLYIRATLKSGIFSFGGASEYMAHLKTDQVSWTQKLKKRVYQSVRRGVLKSAYEAWAVPDNRQWDDIKIKYSFVDEVKNEIMDGFASAGVGRAVSRG